MGDSSRSSADKRSARRDRIDGEHLSREADASDDCDGLGHFEDSCLDVDSDKSDLFDELRFDGPRNAPWAVASGTTTSWHPNKSVGKSISPSAVTITLESVRWTAFLVEAAKAFVLVAQPIVRRKPT